MRELENVIFNACDAASGSWVKVSDLPPLDPAAAPIPAGSATPISLRDAERLAIQEALRRAGGNKSLASRVVGISRKQLYVKLRLYALDG